MNEWITDYLAYLKNKNFSMHTLRAYHTALAEFAQFCQVRHVPPNKALTPANLRAFLAAIQLSNPARNTVLRKIATLRSFAKYLLRQGKLAKNPFALLPSPKREKPCCPSRF